MKKAAEENQEMEKNELEILGERAGERTRESRVTIRGEDNQTPTFDQRNHERDGAKTTGEIESQSGRNRLASGSDSVAGRYAPDEFGAVPSASNWGEGGKGNRSNLEGIRSEGSTNIPAEKRHERHGEISSEHSGIVGRTLSQREAGSVEGSSGRGGSDRPTLGSDQKSGGENQFIAKIIKLEKRILKLATEYKTIADLLAMARKDGGQRHHQHEEETTKQQATRRMRA